MNCRVERKEFLEVSFGLVWNWNFGPRGIHKTVSPLLSSRDRIWSLVSQGNFRGKGSGNGGVGNIVVQGYWSIRLLESLGPSRKVGGTVGGSGFHGSKERTWRSHRGTEEKESEGRFVSVVSFHPKMKGLDNLEGIGSREDFTLSASGSPYTEPCRY